MLDVFWEELDTLFDLIMEDHAFNSAWRALAGEWPKNAEEKKQLEILLPHSTRSGRKLEYKGKNCVPKKAFARITELALDSRLSGHFDFANTLDRDRRRDGKRILLSHTTYLNVDFQMPSYPTWTHASPPTFGRTFKIGRRETQDEQ